MLLLRLLGKFCLFLGLCALAYDGMRMLSTPGEGLIFTSVDALTRAVLAAVHAVPPGGGQAPASFWGYALGPLAVLPASLVLSGLGAALFLIGANAKLFARARR